MTTKAKIRKTQMILMTLFTLGVGLFIASGMSIQNRSDPSLTLQNDIEKKLKDLNLKLIEPRPSRALFKKVVIVDNMAYLSGHIPLTESGEIMRGKVGADVSVEQGAAAARQCALALLGSLRQELGSLNRVERLVKTTGMVNCTPDFTQQPEVINGCSQVLVDLLGEDLGRGTRAAVGMSSLPRGAICEIEMIFQLKEK